MVIKYHHSSLCLSHVLQKMCVIKEPTRKLPTLSYLPKTSYCLMWDRCMTGLWKPGRQPTALPPRIGGDIGPSFQSSSRELPNNNNNTRLHPSLSFWRYGSCSHFNGLERPMSGAISAMRSRSGSRELGRGSSSVPFSRIGSSVQSFFGSLASRVQAKPSSVQPSSQTSFAKKMGPQCRSFSTISEVSGVHPLALSRPERDIELVLQDAPTRTRLVGVDVDADIGLYIDHRMKSSDDMKEWDDIVKRKVREVLTSKAEGMSVLLQDIRHPELRSLTHS